MEQIDSAVAQAQSRLVEQTLVEPLSPDPDDRRRWTDCTLATFVEHRLGTVADPWQEIDEATRAEWARRATDDGRLEEPDDRFATPYWITCAGARVGTVALSNHALNRLPALTSLYVRPEHRRSGHARRVVAAAATEAIEAGLDGIQLETSWCWQPAVTLYCDLSMWVRSWKRQLTFVWMRGLPRWSIEVDGSEARFVVRGEPGEPATAVVARREGNRLGWTRTALTTKRDSALGFLAPGTFAVALALRGWPLITSDAEWREQLERGWSDAGGPVGLAFKIRLWEAWARERGWLVATPRIPGLDYASWDELNR